MNEPEFQIYECENPDCRFRCPNDLTRRFMEKCPVCGGVFTPRGEPFRNFQQHEAGSATSAYEIEVVLDNLRSTLNVGSIFRTADGAGVRHIYCCGTTPTPHHPKIGKSGLGAEDFTPWTYCRNALELVQERKITGFHIVSLEATAASSSVFTMASFSRNAKLLLVMGNEVSGIDPAILALSDRVYAIPMQGRKTSLNVAVAFGIAVYALVNC